jgi:hypothetical protein
MDKSDEHPFSWWLYLVELACVSAFFLVLSICVALFMVGYPDRLRTLIRGIDQYWRADLVLLALALFPVLKHRISKIGPSGIGFHDAESARTEENAQRTKRPMPKGKA